MTDEPVNQELVDLLATVTLGIVMGLGGVLALLVRPSLFDELHDQITGRTSHPTEPHPGLR